MERVFLSVLNMSITAGFVILAVVTVRLFMGRAPKKYSYLLWSVVAFRLACPVSFSSVFSLFGLRIFGRMAAQSRGQARLTYVAGNMEPLQPPQTVGVLAGGGGGNAQLPAAGAANQGGFWQIVLAYGAVIWLAGLAVMALYGLVSYIVLRNRMRTAVLLKKNVYQSDRMRSPFILGMIGPKIYIPFGLGEEMQRYVLLHERYHLKRRDHLIKWFAFVLLTIHWFNPLCWLAFVLMDRDMEMSCDEKVLSLEKNIRKRYSTALLSFATNRRIPMPGPLAFGEAGVKGRIRNVLHWRRPKFYLTALAVVVCGIVAAACAANPASVEEPEEGGPANEWESQEGQVADTQTDLIAGEEGEAKQTAAPEPIQTSTAEDGSPKPDNATGPVVETQDGIRKFTVGDVAVWELDASTFQDGIRLDADGDGTMEHIYLTAPTAPQLEWGHYMVEEGYTLHVEGQQIEEYGSYVECAIMALTLDGENLLLGIFDEGPSGDPVTKFYRYEKSGLYAAGEVLGDIRTLPIGENGVIPCPFRADAIQSSFATGYWYWNGEAVVMREDPEYFYIQYEGQAEFPLTLLEELLVYPQPGDVGEPVVMAPQPVREVKTDLDGGLYLQAQDGTQGWIRAVPSYLPSMGDRQAVEVFEGLQFFD